jgi:hypothetical protein
MLVSIGILSVQTAFSSRAGRAAHPARKSTQGLSPVYEALLRFSAAQGG